MNKQIIEKIKSIEFDGTIFISCLAYMLGLVKDKHKEAQDLLERFQDTFHAYNHYEPPMLLQEYIKVNKYQMFYNSI